MKKIVSLIFVLLLVACQGEPFALEEPYSVGILRSGPQSELVYYDENLNEIGLQEIDKLVVPPITRFKNELLLYGFDNDFVFFKMNTGDGSLHQQHQVGGQLINSTFDQQNIIYLRSFNGQAFLVKRGVDQQEIELTDVNPKSIHLFNNQIIVVTGDQNQTLQVYNDDLELVNEIETNLILSHRSLVNEDKLLFLGKKNDDVVLFELNELYQIRTRLVSNDASDLAVYNDQYLVLSGSPSTIHFIDAQSLEVMNEVKLDETLGNIHIDAVNNLLYGREIAQEDNYLVKYRLSEQSIEFENKVGTNTQNEEQVFTFIFTP